MFCNRQKNRFANIFPCKRETHYNIISNCNELRILSDDESRVVLKELPGLLGSDYINASWINVNKNVIRIA